MNNTTVAVIYILMASLNHFRSLPIGSAIVPADATPRQVFELIRDGDRCNLEPKINIKLIDNWFMDFEIIVYLNDKYYVEGPGIDMHGEWAEYSTLVEATLRCEHEIINSFLKED